LKRTLLAATVAALAALAIGCGTTTNDQEFTQIIDPGAQLPSQTTRLIGLRADNTLVEFNSDRPGTQLTTTALTGLAANEQLVAIDVRPANGALYGMSNQGRLYILDRLAGRAIPITNNVVAPLVGRTDFDIDFNPQVDRLRVVSRSGLNLNVNPNTNVIQAADTNVAYIQNDVNFGQTPAVQGVAYTNPVAGATSTTLFGLDTNRDTVVLQNPPASGGLATVAPLGGIDLGALTGFDIAQNNDAYFVTQLPNSGVSRLFYYNQPTNRILPVGDVTGTVPVISIAASQVLPTQQNFVGIGRPE
jgi:hypothetical protein